MASAGQTICRTGGLALMILAAMTSPSLAKRKAAKPAALPPVALPCLTYAPAVVDVTGVLQREAFARPPVEDLFVDPNHPEVEETPPEAAPGTLPPPAASLSSLPATEATPAPPPPPAHAPVAPAPSPGPDTAAVDPAFIGPMMPASADGLPALAVVDPVLMRAKPVKRPLPTEMVWVLALRPDICVDVDPTDRVNTSEKRVRKLQLVIDRSIEPSLRPLQKKKVVIQGQLFHAVTRGHYLPVLINAATIRPPEWTPELTELQPLQPLPTTPR